MHANTTSSSMRGLPGGSMVFALPLLLLLVGPTTAFARDSEILSVSAAHRVNPYLTMRDLALKSGQRLQAASIASPPRAPHGYELERELDTMSVSDLARLSASSTAAKLLPVPAFDWVFGCSSVSAAMIAGYHDRNGYPDIYTGPGNDGVAPLDNSVWGTWSDGSSTYPDIPLVATRQGVDGRTARGSLDDYWVGYGSSKQDPYLTKGWSQHAWGDAIGDYMKTSQAVYGNTDGSTTFYGWGSSSAVPLTCSEMEKYGVSSKDGTYGRKLFYEARGYAVGDCYNQSTDNVAAGGFSFDDYKSEVDAGRPVMLNLEGHTVVGVGYDDATYQIYIHDTWDYATHTMSWGGSYAGMKLISVSIVNLTSSATDRVTVSATAGSGGSITPAVQSLGRGAIATLLVTPDSGYSIASVRGCAGSLSGHVYTTGSLQSNCAVTATFSSGHDRSIDFDAEFYLNEYPDLRAAFGDDYQAARDHWVGSGIQECRRGSAEFDPRFYLDEYPDVAAAFGHDCRAALDHWLRYGLEEGRRGSLEFDARFYLDEYLDLRNAYGTDYESAIEHWMSDGVKEGRRGSRDFDVQFYLDKYADLRAIYGDDYQAALWHWIDHGLAEGRRGA